MSTHKWMDIICAAAVLFSLLLSILFLNGERLGLQASASAMGYETRLFDTERVHTIDIVMDDWESFLETCENEEYAACAVVIDGESYHNLGIRAKGNTSLSAVSAMNSDRYSFKLEFDHYESGRTCQGLDKLCLNNLIQDNTYMKDYLTYRMMAEFGAAAPLCSFARITVNGQDWGLYLAVEGVEDSFLQRSYGSGHGSLYKPDSMSFGGGRGNGREFRMDGMSPGEMPRRPREPAQGWERPAAGEETPRGGEQIALPEEPAPGGVRTVPLEGAAQWDGGPGGGMGADDVKLKYTDGDPASYANIFENAKTEVNPADQARLIQALKELGEGNTGVLDRDAVLRYLVVHNFVVNGDSYTGSMVHNYYLYEEDGQLSMIPWDYNLAFGTFQSLSASQAVNDPIDTPLSVAGDGDRPMMDWILSDGEALALYHQYFAEFLETVDPAAILRETYALIEEWVDWDPTKFCTMEEFRTGVQALETFCALRRESVAGQLVGTVPSTRTGQSEDGSVLVDASGLTLSDMGTMNMGGGAPGRNGGAAENPPEEDGTGAAAFRLERPGGEEPGGEAASPGAAALCLVSVLALLGGLLAVFRWKRFA